MERTLLSFKEKCEERNGTMKRMKDRKQREHRTDRSKKRRERDVCVHIDQ